MIIKKTVFVIPGFRHRPKNKAYKAIAKILRSEGYLPVLINIPWKQTTISENTEYFLKKYKKINRKKKYILGFSFGAMIAFLASTKVNVSGLILCSLSPYFKEDLSETNSHMVSSITLQRYEDFSKLHCATLAQQTKAEQIHMLYGSKEARSLKRRVSDVFGRISSTHKHLIPIEKTEHNIGDRRYLNKIHQIAKQLN